MKQLALFASGSGSNVLNLIQYFKNHTDIRVSLVVSNNAASGALIHAKNNGINTFVLEKSKLNDGCFILNKLKTEKIDFIILAGYLKIIPHELIAAYQNKIINIHPSLLPKFGGKGMFGKNVHTAVFHAREKESGITVHFVNENYDEGKIITQKKVALVSNDDIDCIEKKVRELEIKWFPVIVEDIILNNSHAF